ncbi:MAG: isoprenylcysteine carboxylmethyltransferase family protein [bacterium]
MKYLVLSTFWIIWCVIHSAMISMTATDYLKSRLGRGFRFYRLFYNSVAVATLIPVLIYTYAIHDRPVFLWDGYLRVIQILLLTAAVLLFYGGARRFDMFRLLGIRQIQEREVREPISSGNPLDMTGVLGMVRHPWYLGVILFIWARDMSPSVFIVNMILTIYVVVGTLLEERKLVFEFGDAYREYQKRVPMLIPFSRILWGRPRWERS